MTEVFTLGDVSIEVTRKSVKHVHLSVHPPDGRVTVVAPTASRTAVVRAFAATKLPWIRERQAQLLGQAREQPRSYVTRESHFLWGKRYLLNVVERNVKPCVSLSHREINLSVRPGTGREQRAAVLHGWHKDLLHAEVPRVIEAWESRLRVQVKAYFLQRMKTKWGSCSIERRSIRINTELVKKPKALLEYVVVHEMLHLRVPTHSKRFIELLDEHFQGWREARQELNALPLAAERWRVAKHR